MGALPRPDLPPGPAADLFTRLHEQHHAAGWPSLRSMAKEIGCSPTTVSVAFSAPRIPRWGLLELIVETLGGDPDEFRALWLAASKAPVPAPAPTEGRETPRLLPGDVVAFTGREAELRALEELRTRTGNAARIAVVSGTAGVGKTAVAVHWAHRVARHFPDGQIYLNLRGYDPGQPVAAGDALGALLGALGIEPERMPSDTDGRAMRFRSLVAGRRLLLVLDNVQSVEQVRDLLPGSASCLVVVTSRSTLSGLVARYGAARVPLDLLGEDDSRQLLVALIGARARDSVEAVDSLARACAHLPLALRIAAERVVSRPAVPLETTVEQLAGTTRRLDLLDSGDDEFSTVRAVFSWSCDQLSPEEDRAFQLLGTIPGRDLDAAAASALFDADQLRAAGLLDSLARVHLVDERRPGRFAMHDLLRAFALDRSRSLPEGEVTDARDRLLAHHLDRSLDAGAELSAERRSWFDAEWQNLVTTAVAVTEERPDHTVAVAAAIAEYLDESSRFEAGESLHRAALAAARTEGERGIALNNLAQVHSRVGRFRHAEAELSQALEAHRQAGNRSGEAAAMLGLGRLSWRRGAYLDASRALTVACDLYRELGGGPGEGAALYNLGIVSRRRGDYAMAEKQHQAAIDVLMAVADLSGEARARNNLSIVRLHLGRYDEASADLTRALEIHTARNDVVGQAVVLDNLGTVATRKGDFAVAVERHRRALELYQEVGYRTGEGDALRGVGVALAGLGRTAAAHEHLTRAVEIGAELGEAEIETTARLDLADLLLRMRRNADAARQFELARETAERVEDRYQQARAWAGTAELHWVEGRADEAKTSWQRALGLYEELSLPDADDVRRRLAHAEG